MRLEKIDELDKIIGTEKIAIYGTGWIAKLLYLFISYSNGAETDIEIVKTGEKTEVSWEQPIFEKISNESMPIIVAKKEIQGKEFAEKIESDISVKNDVYYISENLKNDIDAKMMMECPAEYELMVLNSRKEELDSVMTRKIGATITEIMSEEEFPIFDGIEFETINRCNGECSFCPVNKYDDPRHMEKMSEKLFKKLVLELKTMNYKGRVAMYSNNEPFLDDRIIDFTKYARNELPDVFLYIFTNGSLLDLDKFKEIIDYLDFLCLDLYYDRIEELGAENIRDITTFCEKKQLCHKVMIQTINRNAIRNNRGGGSKNRHNVYQPKSPCILPFTQMIVRPDGKVSLCCNDPLGEYTMADLNEVTIKEAWNSTMYQNIRKKIGESRQLVQKCAMCDNYSTTNQNGNMIFTQTQIRDSWEAYKDKIANI